MGIFQQIQIQLMQPMRVVRAPLEMRRLVEICQRVSSEGKRGLS
jgi:hypothetical protein